MTTAFVPPEDDVCAWGHQLARGVDDIRIGEDEVVSLRRHACVGPRGIYQGGVRVQAVKDMRGNIIEPERVDGANPQDHGMTPTDRTRLIPYPCSHALSREEVGDPSVTATAGAVEGLAGSFGRAHWLTFQPGVPPVALIARCPVCRGEPAPDWRS